MRKEQSKKQRQIFKRQEYEDVVKHSAPFLGIKFMMKHYLKLYSLFLVTYLVGTYLMFKYDWMKFSEFNFQTFFDKNHHTSLEFETLDMMAKTHNYSYVSKLDNQTFSKEATLIQIPEEDLEQIRILHQQAHPEPEASHDDQEVFA